MFYYSSNIINFVSQKIKITLLNLKRICLWSSPRNISTALMYSFAQRPDTVVIDEPLYAHYLKVTDADHPGKDEIMSFMETDGDIVVKKIILGSYDKEIVFMKQMTHHLTELDESFLEKVTNIFLIRNPKLLIKSLSKVLNNVTIRDTGIKKQHEIFQHLKSNGKTPVVIDSGQILKNPEKALSMLCEKTGIPFQREMLEWKAGPRKEDGVWAKYWYKNVHSSTGFSTEITIDEQFPHEYENLLNECMEYYSNLYEHSLKIDN